MVNAGERTNTKQHNEKNPIPEDLLTELMEVQFAGGIVPEIHTSDTFDLDNVDMAAPSSPTNAMQFDYINDNEEICNLFSNSSFQNSMHGIFEQLEKETVLSNQSASQAFLRETFSSTYPTTESCNVTNANCGLTLHLNGNTQPSTPSTITTTENAFALIPTPVSMVSNEVYPPSDNKTLSLNQATEPEKARVGNPKFKRTTIRTSRYRGVTRHRWTGRYEAHLWDNSFIKEGHKRKGRQGGYDTELKAARAYDKAALKYWGDKSTINFPITEYKEELEVMKQMSTVDYINYLKRKSSGFTRGASIYRGVTRHHQKGKWQARIGRINGNKDVYLGTYSTEEEAAITYDIATIKFRGNDSVTNFDKRFYNVPRIKSSSLPIGKLITYIKETGLRNVDGIVNSPRIKEGNRMDTPRGADESKTVHEQQQRNPLLSTSQSHSGFWYKPADDIHAITSISHSHFGQPILTSSNQVGPQIVMSLGPASINDANNIGSMSGIYTNISDVLAANGLVLSDSSVVFANPSNLFATNNFQKIPMETDSNRLVTAKFEDNDFLARNETYSSTQQFTGPGRFENQNLTHNSWIVEPLQSMRPQTNPSNDHAYISPPPWNSKKNSVQME
ncbi:hypothetical protein SUGI_0904170 [Cryptomeria japonica]|nr:hypothetical protein SUGI_0904170 [Cryptomeria japonica]